MNMRLNLTLLLLMTLLSWPVVASAQAAPLSPAPTTVAQNYTQQPVITGVDLQNGTSTFAPGSTINVVVNGTSGCVATFDITGVVSGVAMREVSRGHYLGSYVVPNNVGVKNARLTGSLRARNGQTTRLTANGGLDVGTYASANYPYQPGTTYTTPYQPGTTYTTPNNPYNPYQTVYYPNAPAYANGPIFVNVTSPRQGQNVGSTFTVTGNTVPYAPVTVTARRVSGLMNSGAVTTSGVADANGYFVIPIRLSGSNLLDVILGKSGTANITVTATDPRTSQSRQVQMDIATGQ